MRYCRYRCCRRRRVCRQPRGRRHRRQAFACARVSTTLLIPSFFRPGVTMVAKTPAAHPSAAHTNYGCRGRRSIGVMFGYAVQGPACGNQLSGISGSTERSTIPVKCQPFVTPGEEGAWSRSGFDPMSARLSRPPEQSGTHPGFPILAFGGPGIPGSRPATAPLPSGSDKRRASGAAPEGKYRRLPLEMADGLAAGHPRQRSCRMGPVRGDVPAQRRQRRVNQLTER